MRFFFPVLFALSACEAAYVDERDTDTDTDTDTDVPPIENPSHDEHIQPIWIAKCGDCHTDYNEGGLRLLGAYERIVSIRSEDAPGLNLIEPFEPETSYLWHKISGTHETVGGQGVSMPIGRMKLNDYERVTIENWIINGAPN